MNITIAVRECSCGKQLYTDGIRVDCYSPDEPTRNYISVCSFECASQLIALLQSPFRSKQ